MKTDELQVIERAYEFKNEGSGVRISEIAVLGFPTSQTLPGDF